MSNKWQRDIWYTVRLILAVYQTHDQAPMTLSFAMAGSLLHEFIYPVNYLKQTLNATR